MLGRGGGIDAGIIRGAKFGGEIAEMFAGVFAYGWGGVIPTICARQHISSFLASIHSGNTSSKKTEYEADVMQNGSIVKAKLKIINWRMCVGEEKEAIKTYWNL